MVLVVFAEALGASIYEVFHEFTATIASSIVQGRIALCVLHGPKQTSLLLFRACCAGVIFIRVLGLNTNTVHSKEAHFGLG